MTTHLVHSCGPKMTTPTRSNSKARRTIYPNPLYLSFRVKHSTTVTGKQVCEINLFAQTHILPAFFILFWMSYVVSSLAWR
jgi:hypothetical protein